MILDLIYLCHETADKTKSLFACNPEWGRGGAGRVGAGRGGGRGSWNRPILSVGVANPNTGFASSCARKQRRRRRQRERQ